MLEDPGTQPVMITYLQTLLQHSVNNWDLDIVMHTVIQHLGMMEFPYSITVFPVPQ